MNKTKSLCLHTKKRLAQRFELNFSKDQIKEMGKICRAGNYVCVLKKQSLTRTKAAIFYNKSLFPVVYDKTRKCIITVLKMEMLSNEERKMVEEAYTEFTAKQNLKSTLTY